LKYRAFLSYSHADTGMAMRVHRRLEGFHIDKELVGRVTATGAIPRTLRPIFRDRNDFDAGASLGGQTGATLDDSAALILIASPRSAQSKYVNEEVRLFKAQHPDRPVIPLIVDGEPGGGDNECFPPALRFELAPDGTITDRPADVLAADLRERGDGFDLALAKVVARLIGLSPDDVYRRAERERRRANRLRGMVAAAMVALTIVGGGFYWQSRQQKLTLDEVTALVDKYSLVTPAQAATPDARRSLTDAIAAIAEGAATDPRYAKALDLLKAGKPGDAEPLLKAVAEDKAGRADKNAKDAAAAYRNLATIAGVSDTARAREYYAEAARLDPSDIDGMLSNGWFQQAAGRLDTAQAAYSRVIALTTPLSNENAWWAFWAQLRSGEIQKLRGNLDAALLTAQGAQALAQRFVTSDPGHAGWQRNLAVSNNDIGDVHREQGKLAAALDSYQAALAIYQRQASADPGNADLEADLSNSYSLIGTVQKARGDLPAAQESYEKSLAIRDRQAKSDPSNTDVQRDLSVSHEKIGFLQQDQGDLSAAADSFRASLDIRQRLAQSDPDNADLRHAISIAYETLGNVQFLQGNLSAALSSLRDSLAIAKRLAANCNVVSQLPIAMLPTS
jgi:tetratricopeptide (TPR) repeat protein